MSLLEITNLIALEEDKTILQIPSLHVKDARLVTIIGPNGAGKSTFLRCLLALKAYQGRLILDGVPSIPKNIAGRLAYVPQACHFPFDLTVKDVVLMGGFNRHRGRPQKHDLEIAHRALELTGLTQQTKRSVHNLSGGESQKLHIARALVSEAPILILDEPTSSLDPGAKVNIMQILQDLTHEGRRVVLTTHDLNLVKAYSDWTIGMKGGSANFSKKTDEIQPHDIQQLFGVEVF